ncbi:MAG: TonB-dependent receptor [Rhodothermaeota bacterium MED-G64]|nr:MAG: TonB-dependent receptor [Rhodothermaeota bacterium MED-G64]
MKDHTRGCAFLCALFMLHSITSIQALGGTHALESLQEPTGGLQAQASAQQQVDTLITRPLGEVFVRATRATSEQPFTFVTLQKAAIEAGTDVRDIPQLLSLTPSAVATSDAGHGVGYTGIRIRGVDPTRINVTLNGIPLNDAESQGVFWVNLPDLASSTSSIQVQRGVGTSTNGAGAFGATVNLQTGEHPDASVARVRSSVGAYGTKLVAGQFATGRSEGGWSAEGRFSTIQSDGYIDRASSTLFSGYGSLAKQTGRGVIKLDWMSGREETYQAWNGVPEPIVTGDAAGLERYITGLFIAPDQAERLRSSLGQRTYNEFTYENQVDHYGQDHLQLHASHGFDAPWVVNASLHYTFGKGYYEEYAAGQSLDDYGLSAAGVGGDGGQRFSDLTRRRWLKNHFFGGVVALDWLGSGSGGAATGTASTTAIPPRASQNLDLTLGLAAHHYLGDHFGQVLWTQREVSTPLASPHNYYVNDATKTDANTFAKASWSLVEGWTLFGDLQFRWVSHTFQGKALRDVIGGTGSGATGSPTEVINLESTETFTFFNPKAGVTWQPSQRTKVYASFAVASKEPSRNDLVNSPASQRPTPERLLNTELGLDHQFDAWRMQLNGFWMHYRDQLVLNGAVNDVGEYVRENVPLSDRMGVELSAQWQPTQAFTWDVSATAASHTIRDYVESLDNYDVGGVSTVEHGTTPIAFSPSGILAQQLQWTWNNWTTAAETKWVSRQYLDNTGTESRSIDPYIVTNLQFTGDASNASWAQRLGLDELKLTVRIANVFNEAYVANGYTFGFVAGGETQYFNYVYPQAERHVMTTLRLGF